MNVGIVDYGMGNLKSVANACDRLGYRPAIVSAPELVRQFDQLILPGVGAFSQAISALRSSGFDLALEEFRQSGRPVLGICLGMQLMCRSSQEDGHHTGLGWFAADFIKFPVQPGLRVPQMGWNSVHVDRPHRIVEGLGESFDVYFLHSYCAVTHDDSEVVGTTIHGVAYASILARDNVVAVQFHPEKSHHVGIALLGNFLPRNARC